MNGILGRFDLDAITSDSLPKITGGRQSATLIKTEQLRVVLVHLEAKQTLQEHSAPGPITIHCLRGQMRVGVGADESLLFPGHLISIDSNVRHDAEAISDSSFLLTIAWPPAGQRKHDIPVLDEHGD
ncbi:MAG TPA: cupin domain-containing protein [Thermomicrobiales bacterium]|nr:cupin domain-containing protein [Thermomicrobiales bacterium]HRA48663.1 cupin domain-containing protein [Thermomicrobiales bacterium]